jgi:hypothetical protein
MEEELSEAISLLEARHPVFTLPELMTLLHPGSDRSWDEIRDRLLSDPAYVSLTLMSTSGECPSFVAERALYRWLLFLNLRLADAETFMLTAEQFTRSLEGWYSGLKWDRALAEVVRFGRRFGLCCEAWREGLLAFPLARILAHLDAITRNHVYTEMRNRSLGDFIKVVNAPMSPGAGTSWGDSLRRIALDELSSCYERYREIILAREGLLDGKKQTLSEIGDRLGITRERVRQIYSRFWQTIHRPESLPWTQRYAMALVAYIMARNGSCLWKPDPEEEVIMHFVAKRIGIPAGYFKPLRVFVVGLEPPPGFALWCMKSGALEIEAACNSLDSTFDLPLCKCDLVVLGTEAINWKKSRLSIVKRVRVALEKIGRPAHYSEIAEVYNRLFPERPCSERYIHAALLREQEGCVWIGVKGTYALAEWGYTRPSKRLHELVAEIVEQRYRDTGKPVHSSVVFAEVSKIRGKVRPSSICMALSMNPRVMCIGGSYYIPGKPPSENSTLEDRLDQVLQEFENSSESGTEFS